MSSVSITKFLGEYSSPNPQDCPPGACQTIINAALRQEGTLEADRGFTAVALNTLISPTTALFVDAHSSLWSFATSASSSLLGPAYSNVTLLSPLSGSTTFLNTMGIIPWGWDAGLLDPGNSYFSPAISMQQTGWLMTSRGLAKTEQLTNLLAGTFPVYQGTTTPIPSSLVGQFTVFNSTLNPPLTADILAITGAVTSAVVTNGAHSADAFSWLQVQWSVAYRLVLARKVYDPVNGSTYYQYSEPSSRILFTNTTGSAIDTQVVIPNSCLFACPPDAFVQIYRTQSVPPGVTPSDEMFLVSEVAPASVTPGNWGFIIPGTSSSGPNLIYEDISPDTQIYVPLYTNAGLGNGIQSSNFPAPMSNVMFTFGNRTYYGDTQGQQFFQLLMAGTSAAAGPGLQAGDTVTIAGITYVAATGPAVAPNFQVFTAGTPSVNVRLTSIALVNAINQMSAQNVALPREQRVFAQYTSLGQGDEGQILIRRPLPNSMGFTVQTSNTRGWAQNYTTAIPSSNSPSPGGLYWSKLNQPPHVPIANNVVLGSPSAHVLAGLATRDYGLIFKEDGAWTVTEGLQGPVFSPLDSTVHVEAPRTVVAVQNICFALTSKGVLTIGQYGTENISVPIQREIQSYLTASSTTLFQYAFAISYEAEAEYWLFLPASGAASCYNIKVYNLKTKSWRTAAIAYHLCGIEGHTETTANRVDLTPLMLGCTGGWGINNNYSYNGVLVERKTYTPADQQWDALTPIITDVGNNNDGTYTVSVPPQWYGNGIPLIGRGDLLMVTQGGLTKQYVIKSSVLNAAQTALILTFWVTFTGSIGSLASVQVIPAVQSTIELLPEDAGQPLLSKHWNGAGCLVWNRYFTGPFLDIGWNTELSPLTSTAAIYGPTASLLVGDTVPPLNIQPWAPLSWGSTPWTSQGYDWIMQATIDGADVRGSQLNIALTYYNAQSTFQLSSITFDVDGFSDRSVRA